MSGQLPTSDNSIQGEIVAPDTKNVFDEAEENIRDLAKVAKDLAEDAAMVAKQIAAPDSYSAAASVINTAISANKALVDLDKKRRDAGKGTSGGKSGPQVVNQTLVMTTTDLLAMIKKQQEKALQENDTTTTE